MEKIFSAILLLITLQSLAQSDNIDTDVQQFQQNLVEEYKNPKSSPLNAEAKKHFSGIHFFEVSNSFVVQAAFTRSVNEKPFSMNTSSGKQKQYIKYGVVEFVLNKQHYKLNIYQSLDLLKSDDYKDYLFIPFTDDTNGAETYEGGRYIDLSIPATKTITIDFNKAYQPYCAYTAGYNCPVPPKENYLPLKITAGVKF